MKTKALILSILTCLCSCTLFKDEISELHKEIDTIKIEKIATINEQIKNIQVSISELENYKTSLDSYIKNLQDQDKLLKEAIEAAKASIKDNADDIDSLEGKVSQSEAAISALETRLASVEGTLSTLSGLYESLDGKIADLKKYVTEELSKVESGVKEWANATFCTLEQYYGVTDVITAINSSIVSINSALADMEKSISELEEKLSAEIDSKLASAISTAKDELEASWTEDIEAASTALESSLKTWVNSQLEGYYTAAETDAKLESLQSDLEGKLDAQKTYIEGLITNLGNTLNAQISSNASQIETLIIDLSALESYAQTNAANIAANSESISRNAQAILKNAQDISSINEEELEQIKQKILQNKSLIDENALLISSNTLSLSNLNSSFAQCSEEVKKNASAIASNSAAIAENANLIAANASAIADNASAIAANTTEIAALKKELEEARQSIKKDYEAAISEAFSNAKTEITEVINVNVTEINERIDSEVSAINSKIATIESRVTALEEQLADLVGRVAKLESTIETINTSITTIRGQIYGINSTIDELKATDLSVASAIETLENQSTNLENALSELDALVEQIQQDSQASESAISSHLESLKSTVESELSSISSEIESMKLYASSLDERITALEDCVTELESKISESEADTKAWAEATFATLSEYNATCEELATVKATANAAKTVVETLEEKVNKILTDDIPSALADLETTLRTELEGKINAMGTSLSEAISTARSEITAAYESAISTAVSASEASMKTWINNKLVSYYTAAETDAELALVKQELESELAGQKQSLELQIEELEALVENDANENADSLAAMRTRINKLQQKLDEVSKSNAADIAKLQVEIVSAKEEITTAYKSAIETAITENNGIIDSKIASAISDANSTLSSQISEITSKLEALTARVDALETEVAGIRTELDGLLSDMSSVKKSLEEILSMIQSITVVPDNSDGSVNVSYGDSQTVDFEIFPLAAAEALAGNWSGAVSLRAVYTEPATKSSHTFVDLPVSNVTYADGIVTVTYNSIGLSAEFWNESATANARLLISDGNNCVASQYYLLRPVLDLPSVTDLSSDESANSYIVSSAGAYKFKTTKGNSPESVGNVSSCEVLWESFGTSTAPKPGDLIPFALYKDGYIFIESSSKKGNAVIAAKDESGNILWSWHIWMTDKPQEQVYNNNAGTMMDRNLGASSATPGDVGALGLLYQWGRKDPFLGSSSISSNTEAMSTITWPSAVESNNSTGTIDYVTANPTTFITYNSNNSDWYYTGDSSTDDTRWQSSKTIYDPCPAGWRVPDGGNSGVWATAFGTSSGWTTASNWDSTNKGMDFSKTDKTLGSSGPIWYPASGYRDYSNGGINGVGSSGRYWSVSPGGKAVCSLYFYDSGRVNPANYGNNRAYGHSVRCLKEFSESSSDEPEEVKVYTDISTEGTANSYIVSEKGNYKFKTVKGNSEAAVGMVASAAVLWESFGTATAPSEGDLISGVSYEDGYVSFSTADTFREGNAVIAAKDESGNILWSWHIWMTDEPQEQVYNNNAGTMMDRNLGATSATPGDVGALGLLYQWGRKDPFLGSSSISSNTEASSTITWPSAVASNNSTGTIDYVTANPTTFITRNGENYDWYYPVDSSTDDTRWQSSKTIYDPCPAGWRVPDGGKSGVWATALGTSSGWTTASNWDSTNKGMDFSKTDKTLGSSGPIWYPASGYRYHSSGSIHGVGSSGYYWSVSPYGFVVYCLFFSSTGDVYPAGDYSRASGLSVRCLQE